MNHLINELKVYPQWVLHNKEKVPLQFGGVYADTTNSKTWLTYDMVKNLTLKGFVLTETDPFTCIDLDHCVGAHGRVASETTKIIDFFRSYTEISPSGSGFHIWVRGKIPSAIKRNWIEIYSTERYMTVTENSAFNCPLANCQSQLDAIFEKYGNTQLFNSPELNEPIDCGDELRELYKKSEALRTLWNLESGFYKADGSSDWSSYDMSLASLLWAWPSEKIAWAINFFREEHGAKLKHGKAIALTIAKVKSGLEN